MPNVLQPGDNLQPGQQYTFALVVNFGPDIDVAGYYLKAKGINDYEAPVGQLPYVTDLQLHGDTSWGVLGAAEVTFTYQGDGTDTVSTVANDLVSAFDGVAEPVWNFRYALLGGQAAALGAAPTSSGTLSGLGDTLRSIGLTPGVIWGIVAAGVVLLLGLHWVEKEV